MQWLARNDMREGRKITDTHEIAKSVSHYMEEWQPVWLQGFEDEARTTGEWVLLAQG